MLHDCVVCGVADAGCQQCLLAEADLSFDKAFKMAQTMKLAERDVQQLHSREAAWGTPIQKLQVLPGVGKKNSRPCYRCGGAHDEAQCRFLHAERSMRAQPYNSRTKTKWIYMSGS